MRPAGVSSTLSTAHMSLPPQSASTPPGDESPSTQAPADARGSRWLNGVRDLLEFTLASMPPRGRIGVPDGDAMARWIIPWGLLVGAAWMTVFRVAWRLFGDPEMTRVRVLPALAVVLLECTLTGYLLIVGLSRAAGSAVRHDGPAGATAHAERGPLILMLAVAAHLALFISLPERIGWYPAHDDWRSYLNPLYPQVTYRPLLLAPLWGRWAMILAAGVGRAAPDADELTRALCRAVRPARVLRTLLVPLAVFAVYMNREGQFFQGLFASLIVFLSAYLTALLLARRWGGQTRDTIHAAGAMAQMTFLASYRAFCIPSIG